MTVNHMINSKQKEMLLAQYIWKDILSAKEEFNFDDFSNNINL